MKRLFITIMVAMTAITAFSQIEKDQYLEKKQLETGTILEVTINDPAVEKNAAAIANIQNCMNRFRSQQLLSYYTGFAGTGVAILAASGDYDETLNFVAGGLGVISLYLNLSSYKWMKRASLEPTGSGISYKFNY